MVGEMPFVDPSSPQPKAVIDGVLVGETAAPAGQWPSVAQRHLVVDSATTSRRSMTARTRYTSLGSSRVGGAWDRHEFELAGDGNAFRTPSRHRENQSHAQENRQK